MHTERDNTEIILMSKYSGKNLHNRVNTYNDTRTHEIRLGTYY